MTWVPAQWIQGWAGYGAAGLGHHAAIGGVLMTVARPCGLEWGALPQQREAMLVSAPVPGWL